MTVDFATPTVSAYSGGFEYEPRRRELTISNTA